MSSNPLVNQQGKGMSSVNQVPLFEEETTTEQVIDQLQDLLEWLDED